LRHVRFRFFGGFCHRLFEGKEDCGGSFLDDFQALGEQGRVAVLQVDVICRGSVCLKAYGLADHKRNDLGLGFAQSLGWQCNARGIRTTASWPVALLTWLDAIPKGVLRSGKWL
jgi:hypothetical protein